MIIADWVAIGLVAFFALLGLLVGFGRGLRFFTKGFIGFIISILICYCIGGFVLRFEFVQKLLLDFIGLLEGKGSFCDILLAIHIEMIVFYVVLFIVVTILRIIIVRIIASIFEIENVVIGFFNRLFGAVLFVAILAIIVMIAFQIIYLIGGSTLTSFLSLLEGSKLKLDVFFENNPLMIIIQFFTLKIEVPATP